ncbi:hypothetical protein BH09PSE2_BH09PSE2_09390 [soil metagenome]
MPSRSKSKTSPPPEPVAGGKLNAMLALLRQESGKTIAAMMAATGWQQHSVRGAMAGTLKKKGITVTSEKLADVRVYRIAEEAQ